MVMPSSTYYTFRKIIKGETAMWTSCFPLFEEPCIETLSTYSFSTTYCKGTYFLGTNYAWFPLEWKGNNIFIKFRYLQCFQMFGNGAVGHL